MSKSCPGFYQTLLGGVVNQPDPRWSLGDSWATFHTDGGFVLAFQRVEDHQPPRWPDPARHQMRLERRLADVRQTVAGAGRRERERQMVGKPGCSQRTGCWSPASAPVLRLRPCRRLIRGGEAVLRRAPGRHAADSGGSRTTR
ncbi:VOC family protein [Streptomyces hawaiiensis]|uniref:VOC family protein n=1 Tax=Streptomyces hawaiiensis TaxID=67305 RepID=UPI0036638C3D